MNRVPQQEVDRTVAAFEKHGGNVSLAAKELGIPRQTMQSRVRQTLKLKKPLVAGTVQGLEAKVSKLPIRGEIKRYILTSAQNNTHAHQKVWDSLKTLADYYEADILVGTYSYNQSAYGELAVKRGKATPREDLWFEPELQPYFCDERRELARGLVWCGEMNILPTAQNPLNGLESYTGRNSAIFPHAKLAMRSVPTMQGEGTKLNYTTGTITQRNYIQKRAGLIAEHHHVYGGLLVEVNSDGNWWVRQLNVDDDGTLYDLDLCVQNGGVTTENKVEAITWGDLHATWADEDVLRQSMEMLDVLKPRYQFMHDVLEGVTINHHEWSNPHARFKAHLRGLDSFINELQATSEVLGQFDRKFSTRYVVFSNHDAPWVMRWLREHDYKKDPQNALVFLDTQIEVYKALRDGNTNFHPLEYLFDKLGLKGVNFLREDESFTICDKKIECGMHGHLGPNGKLGTPNNLSPMGRKANTAHTHSAGIVHGLYIAGTSSKLKWDYNHGPSSWTNSHILTYRNAKRAVVTSYNGKWRAVA